MHTTPTLTYFATHFTNGHTRRVAISLPYVACIADDPHYAVPPPARARAARPHAPVAVVGKTHPAHDRPRLREHRPAAQPDRLRGDDAQDRSRRRVNSRIVAVGDVSSRFIPQSSLKLSAH